MTSDDNASEEGLAASRTTSDAALSPASKPSSHAPPHRQAALAELARLFLKLGTLAFGGPAAHIAMMEDEVVRRRGWLTRAQFLDYLGITNMIPGPNSTEMAIHIGYARAGLPGLAVAGICFIGPAALIVGGLAWTYVRFGSLPELAGVLYGVKPVVIAVVFQAIWNLGSSAIRNRGLAAIAAFSAMIAVLGVNELLVLAVGALLGLAWLPMWRKQNQGMRGGLAFVAAPAASTTLLAIIPFSMGSLFFVFLKIGSVLFGSGYVLLAFLQSELVERLGWLSQQQLLDAVAVGQVTPGPVFTTATFIGYILGGTSGAAIATLGVFLPAFFFVAVSAPLLPRLRRSPVAGALLDGVNVASLALMAVVTWQLARVAVVDGITLALAAVSAVALVRLRLNSVWLVAAGAVIGVLVRTFD